MNSVASWAQWFRAARVVLFFLAVWWICRPPVFASTSPASREDLRRLLGLPQVTFTTGVGFATEGRLQLLGERPDPAEVEKARQKLRDEPKDGAGWLKLGDVLRGAEDGQGSAAAYSNAVLHLRAQAEQQPQDGRVLARLGEALDMIGQTEEAESVLRRAVRVAPEDAEAWLALAGCLNGRVIPTMLPEERGEIAAGDLMAMVHFLVHRQKPSASQFEKAERLQTEAMECLNRAAALATNNPVIFERRAACRVTGNITRIVRKNASAEQPDLSPMMSVFFNPACVPDLRRAAEIEPDNAYRLAAVVYYELFSGSLERAGGRVDGLTLENFKELLSADATASIRWNLDRLQEMADSPAPGKAAQAAHYLACIRMAGLHDYQGAEVNFRRAVALDPHREQAWDGLMAALVTEDRDREFLSAAEARLKAQPSARNHVLVAKACERLNRPEKVVEQARLAVALEPKSFLAQATLAIALLQQSDSPETLNHSAQHLKESVTLAAQATDLQKMQLHFARGVLLGLAGQVAEARRVFSELQETSEMGEDAKAALAILDKW